MFSQNFPANICLFKVSNRNTRKDVKFVALSDLYMLPVLMGKTFAIYTIISSYSGPVLGLIRVCLHAFLLGMIRLT